MGKDITRLVSTMVGALVGGAIGLYGLLATFEYYDEMISRGGILPLLVVLLFCGGGLVGGGYAVLSLHLWREKVAQRKKEASKKKYGRKKR